MISSLSFQFFNYTPIITIPFFLASRWENREGGKEEERKGT
jgi:hypothetical protein